ncbi:MAG TPA: DUF2905 family protein [Magnetospirillaceae bacterium]|nr:DUF2905 family protein [Magnetospirillaceae bacterium]
MDVTPQIGRFLIGAGLALIAVGALVLYVRQLHLGSLPGDVTIGGKGWQATLLLGTSLLLSIVFTIVLNLLLRRR